MKTWTTKDIPSQRGRLAVIIGATGGLGFETALALAGAGAQVSTALFSNGQRLGGNGKPAWIETLSGWLPSVLAQTASDGALPSLYAATSPNVVKAGYYGPTGLMEFKSGVGEATVAPRARDQAVAAKLWEVSETLTGVHWAAVPHAPKLAARVFA